MFTCVKTESEVGEDDKPESDIQPLDPARTRHERRGHDEYDSYRIEDEETVSKSMRDAALTEIQITK
jgi:hypothetical protein